MQTILVILITVLLFGILIFIHELGHFLTARWAKVKINEFAIGMGPAILKKQGKETLYSLRIFPIGGYVNMEGEDGDDTDENAFCRKPKWKRFIILVAGAFNNIVFGFLLTCLVYGLMTGLTLYPTTIVAEFNEKAVSSEHGLQVGDEIYSVDGYRIYTYTDLSYAFTKNSTKPLDIVVMRNGQKVTLQEIVFPTATSEYSGDYFTPDFKVYGNQRNVWTTLKYSFNSTVSISRSIYSFFGSLLTGKANFNNVSGPVGTTQVIGEAVATEGGIDFGSLFLMMAMISINLGIVNLFPLPALDGGRVALLLYEAITRKKVNEKVEMIINGIGFLLLIALMIIITVKDVIKLF